MEFCPECGCIMSGDGESSKCQRCGHKSKDKLKIESSEKIETKQGVAFIDEKGSSVLPVMEATCRKCKNKEAYFWMQQTRAADEAPTRFFKCTKCNHTWREYR
jgi:transcription factor S